MQAFEVGSLVDGLAAVELVRVGLCGGAVAAARSTLAFALLGGSGNMVSQLERPQ